MKAKKLALCALCAAMTVVCAWLSLPLGSITFTLQSFAVSLSLLLLGGKWGAVSVFVYLLLGAVGLPVFSGFRGGIGMVLGATGGYLFGFLAMALVFWLITAVFGEKCRIPALISGQLACYACGTVWMAAVYVRQWSSILSLLTVCVAPYVLPDAAKLLLACLLAKRLRRWL